jgi:hypothetical protein
MAVKTNKKPKSREVKILFSEFLQRVEVQASVNLVVAQDILNYFNHKNDIASGLADSIVWRESTPFFYSEFSSLSNLVSEIAKYFERDCGISSWQFQGAIRVVLSEYLAENWSSIVKQRLMIEDRFISPNSFIAMRRYVIVLKGLGIHFYTKDRDGCGPDLIENLVTTDLVHSSYETMNNIQTSYSTSAVKNALKGFRSFYMFANLNYNIINDSKDGKEFFGPVSYQSYFKTLNSRKEQILESLADLSERLSLPITIEMKFKAKSDRIVFNTVWERKLPEIFYEISNHRANNRFS